MWLQWVFFLASLAVGGYYLETLVTRRGTPRDSEWSLPAPSHDLSHLTMALGMAAMFSPIRIPVPHLAWVLIFGVGSAWFASCALREGLTTQSWRGVDTTVHHLVANLAMLFMLRAPSHQPATGSAGAGGHAGHHSASAGGGWLDGPIGTMLAVLLIGYFLVHTGRASGALFSAPGAALPGHAPEEAPELSEAGPVAVVAARRRITSSRAAAASHVVMGIAMAVMFGLML